MKQTTDKLKGRIEELEGKLVQLQANNESLSRSVRYAWNYNRRLRDSVIKLSQALELLAKRGIDEDDTSS
jgi:hypothetical protein